MWIATLMHFGKRFPGLWTEYPFLPNPIVQWVYSLDQTTILGPYEMICGETLVVQVDEREWGVLVESEQLVTVDVWF